MLVNLVKWQDENGYKNKWVAEKLGMSESMYSKLKYGKIKATIEHAYKFQEVFGIDDVVNFLRNEG